MTTLADFLLARIAEDEDSSLNWSRFEIRDGIPGSYGIRERVLAECEAKRRIIEFVGAWFADGAADHELLRTLAAVYADHSDYRDEWSLTASPD